MRYLVRVRRPIPEPYEQWYGVGSVKVVGGKENGVMVVNPAHWGCESIVEWARTRKTYWCAYDWELIP